MMIPVRKIISNCVPVLTAAPLKKVHEAHSSTHTPLKVWASKPVWILQRRENALIDSLVIHLVTTVTELPHNNLSPDC